MSGPPMSAASMQGGYQPGDQWFRQFEFRRFGILHALCSVGRVFVRLSRSVVPSNTAAILTHSVHCELLGPMNSMPNMGSMPAMPGWSLARFQNPIFIQYLEPNTAKCDWLKIELKYIYIYIHTNSLFSPSVCFLLAAPSFRDFVTRAVSEAWMFLIKL